MARRSEHSQEEIKEMVLKAAELIVKEEGFKQLKVRKIAMEIGYTVGSIYMVFDNMADLILQLKARTLDDIHHILRKSIDVNTSDEIITVLAKAYFLFACQHLNRWQMLFESYSSDNKNPPLWYQHKVETIFTLVENQFKKLSPLSTEQQNKQATRALWSSVHGICHLSLSTQPDLIEMYQIENNLMLLIDNFLKGWLLNLSDNN